jgi:hypothetical protein
MADLFIGAPFCSLACPDPKPDCGDTLTLSPDSLFGTTPLSFRWYFDDLCDWEILSGQDTDTLTFVIGPDTCCTIFLEIMDEFGCADTCMVYCCCTPPPESLCTFTMGGWGNRCPDPQMGDLMSTQPGCIRDHYFDTVFDNGVWIGDTTSLTGSMPYGAKFYTAHDVRDYLPCGGTPRALSNDYINPDCMPETKNTLASQLLALRMNVEYSCAGVFTTLGLPGGCVGDAAVPDTCDPMGLFTGKTVRKFQAAADSAIAGHDMSHYGVPISYFNWVASCMNELWHENCGDDDEEIPDKRLSTAPLKPGPERDRATLTRLPTEFSIEQSYPNPFNPMTEILYALPNDCHVTLSIYNVLGQRVKVLVDEHQSAGYKTVQWDGRDDYGQSLTSGVFFYRIEAGNFVQMKKMVLIR